MCRLTPTQCPLPLIGNGLECSNDTDLDGIPDSLLTIGCEGPEKCFKVSQSTLAAM